MAPLTCLFLLISLLFQCITSSARLQQRIPLTTGSNPSLSHSSASTLVLTPSTAPNQIVTFYPSRVSDSSLWTITTVTVIASTETIYPSGYEWIPSPVPSFSAPVIPTDAPYPTPGSSSISFAPTNTTGYAPSAFGATSFQSTNTGSAGSSSSSPSLGSVPSSPTSSPTSGPGSVPSSFGTGYTPGFSSSLARGSSNSAFPSTASGSSPPYPTTQSSVAGLAGTGSSHSPSSIVNPSSTGTGIPSTRAGSPISGSINNSPSSLPTGISLSRSQSIGTGVSPSTFRTGITPPSSQSTGISPSRSRSIGTGISASGSSTLGTGISLSSSSTFGTGIGPSRSTSTGTSPSNTGSSSSGSSLSSTKRVTSGSSTSSYSSASVSGSWSASQTQPTTSFIFPNIPSSTVTGAAATSEAALVGGLFLALHADREWITDATLKSKYIENVKKVKDETSSLINDLDIKPPAPPECSKSKRKRNAIPERKLRALLANRSALSERSLISGVTGLIGDAAKLLSCASKVLDNLIQAVESPDPPIPDIENLTDDLKDIGNDLQQEENDPSNSASNSQASSTKSQDSTSASSASSTASSSSSSSSSGGAYCAPTCSACIDNSVPQRSAPASRNRRRSDSIDKRTLETPEDFSSINEFMLEQLDAPGSKELNHRVTGKHSSAITGTWDTQPKNLWVAGLYGCTSVVIVGEGGAWLSHYYEDPSFIRTETQFQDEVIGATRDGDTAQMPSPFGLQNSGNVLAAGTNVQIFISTPKDPNTGNLLFGDKIGELQDLLTGPNGPYHGVTVTTRSYVKPTEEEQNNPQFMKKLQYTTRGKVLIQYDNNQKDDPPAPNQRAIWRVWLEDQKYEHEWDATDAQKGACAAPGKHKRDGSSALGCSKPTQSASTSSVSASTASTATSGSRSGTGTSPTSSTSSTGTSQSLTRSPGNGPITSGPTATSSSSVAPKFTNQCYPFADPDAGIAQAVCQCDGLPGKYPALSSPSGATSFNICGYTTPPTVSTSSVPPFTTTSSDGDVIVCETSTYFNYAVDTHAECAGSTTVISTVASVASAYSVSVSAHSVSAMVSASSVSASAASVSSASAEASWSSAAAVPSAGCWILDDDGFGDSAFAVYGINGWAGDKGDSLNQQENGCGILSGWSWDTTQQEEFQGRMRNTQTASFGLSFFKGGCVERAVHSAGGPEPGNGPGQLACQHYNGQDENLATQSKSIKSAQLQAVGNVANSGQTTGSTANQEKLAVANGQTNQATNPNPNQYAPDIKASASAALPHLQTAVSSAATAAPAAPGT